MEEYLHINEKKTNISPVVAHYETSFVHDGIPVSSFKVNL